jgi:hypothetical protein
MGKYHLNENEVVSLVATRMIVDFSTSKDMVYQALQRNIEKYISNVYLSLNPSMYWIQKIMESYNSLVLRVTEKLQAKISFINLLKTNNHLWEVQQFNVKVCILLVNCNSFHQNTM